MNARYLVEMEEVNTNKVAKSIKSSNPLGGTQKKAHIIALFLLLRG
jgi:hypothetical protein